MLLSEHLYTDHIECSILSSLIIYSCYYTYLHDHCFFFLTNRIPSNILTFIPLHHPGFLSPGVRLFRDLKLLFTDSPINGTGILTDLSDLQTHALLPAAVSKNNMQETITHSLAFLIHCWILITIQKPSYHRSH